MADDISFEIDSSVQSLPPDYVSYDGSKDEDVAPKPLTRSVASRSFGTLIGSVHWIAARALDEEQIELSKQEKQAYGEVTYDLLKAYGYDMSIHPKFSAWINFTTVALEIDGPRVVLIITRAPDIKDVGEPQGEPPPIVMPVKR